MGWISWLCPGMNLKRWLLLFTVGVLCCALGLALFFNYQFMGYVEELMFRMTYLTTGKYSNTVSMLGGFLFLCVGGFVMVYATRRVIRSVVEAVTPLLRLPMTAARPGVCARKWALSRRAICATALSRWPTASL